MESLKEIRLRLVLVFEDQKTIRLSAIVIFSVADWVSINRHGHTDIMDICNVPPILKRSK